MKSGANRPQVFNENKISGEKLTLSGGENSHKLSQEKLGESRM